MSSIAVRQLARTHRASSSAPVVEDLGQDIQVAPHAERCAENMETVHLADSPAASIRALATCNHRQIRNKTPWQIEMLA